MKRLYTLLCICVLAIALSILPAIGSKAIKDPIPKPIAKSKLSIGFQELAQIPKSGTGRDTKTARINFLTHAGDGSGRLFVNDMRGKLYVIDRGKASVYTNTKSLICQYFTDETSQQGFAYFAFHPNFKQNGIFYTVNSELKEDRIPDFPVRKQILDNNGNAIESSHHDVIRD